MNPLLQKHTLKAFRDKINANLVLLKAAESEIAEVNEKIDKEKRHKEALAEATTILRDLYEQTQERFHGQIQQIVTYCLKEVFGEEAYEFRINFTQKRNQVEATLVFVRDGEEFDPLQAAGGGVLAVACFALRMAVLYLMRRDVRRIMILDEPFSQVSKEYREAMASLLERTAEEFGMQYIIITHSPEFEVGKVYRIGNEKDDE